MSKKVYKEAEISSCSQYRYCLWRQWGIGRSVTFVMLNPSIADANIDDPTIRKCIGFARQWGYNQLVVANVMAYRATKPTDLPSDIAIAIGPDNANWLEYSATYSELIILAWGAPTNRFQHAYRIADAILKRIAGQHDTPIECLGLTKAFGPKHPLFVPYDTIRTVWK